MKSGTINKIYIVGAASSGKTTLAKKICTKLNCTCNHLDDIVWKTKFDKRRNDKEIEKKLKRALKGNKWVVEGSYATQDWVKKIAKKSDAVIWLDKPDPLLIWRIIKRSITRKKLSKNHSRFKEMLYLIKWLKQYRGDIYQKMHKEMVKGHSKGIKLQSDNQIKDFLKRLNP